MEKGVILLNMGGPNNLDEVEIFLKNMFNDKNIIIVKSDILRKFIAFMIVNSRKKIAKENYKKIGGSSPIINHTKNLVLKLNKSLHDFKVDFAMCYTPPFVDEVLKNFLTCKKIILFPMYPHYSTTTVKSSLEDFNLHVEKLDIDFEIKIINEFYKNDEYNKLLIKLIKQTLKQDLDSEFDLIFSAHSLPQKIINNGDVYQMQIEEHVKILSKMLEKENINFNKIHLAYQSKLGPVKWLKPELGEALKQLKNKKVIIFPISFTIDNSETDFELSMEYKTQALKLGFNDYRVCKCPNDDEDFVNMIAKILAYM